MKEKDKNEIGDKFWRVYDAIEALERDAGDPVIDRVVAILLGYRGDLLCEYIDACNRKPERPVCEK